MTRARLAELLRGPVSPRTEEMLLDWLTALAVIAAGLWIATS